MRKKTFLFKGLLTLIFTCCIAPEIVDLDEVGEGHNVWQASPQDEWLVVDINDKPDDEGRADLIKYLIPKQDLVIQESKTKDKPTVQFDLIKCMWNVVSRHEFAIKDFKDCFNNCFSVTINFNINLPEKFEPNLKPSPDILDPYLNQQAFYYPSTAPRATEVVECSTQCDEHDIKRHLALIIKKCDVNN